MCLSFWNLEYICLFIEITINNSNATHHLFLFTYANWLLTRFGYRFNIQYLFLYLFKAMSTTAAQLTTCFYLLMQIACWLHVVFVLIFSIFCLFIQSHVNNSSASHHLFLSTYANCFLITCAFCFNIEYLFVYLFKAMSTKAGGTDHLFLFTYGNLLLITCGFPFNIYYLFIYLFKAILRKAGGSNHLFLFTYVNHLLRDVLFLLIFIIYLFIQNDVKKSRWNRQPLFTYTNNLLWQMVFVLIFSKSSPVLLII